MQLSQPQPFQAGLLVKQNDVSLVQIFQVMSSCHGNQAVKEVPAAAQ